jgi:hypothetical protein
MTNTLHVGTLLIEDGTPRPELLVVSTEPYSARWSCIAKFTSAQLGREIESAGWTFFYMAGEIRTRSFGFNDQARTDRAVGRVMDAVKLQNCNCLEITQMRRGSFLGLPYTSVVAYARHIQKSRMFQTPSHIGRCAESHYRESSHDQPSRVLGRTLFTGAGVQAWENEGGSRAESKPHLEVI